MIIVEGVDKAGKTTLIKDLAKQLDYPVKKFGIPVGDPIPGYIDELRSVRQPTIYDRFIYGEIPYSIVKKRERFMKRLELTVLDLMVQSFPHIVLYVRPERSVILNRIMALGDSYISENEAIKVYEEYDEMFAEVHTNVLMVNENTDFENILNSVYAAVNLDKWAQCEVLRSMNMEGIGTLTPKYLFVGDRYNTNAPYQVTLCSKAGEYLFKALDTANIPLYECHFVNSINKDLKQLSSEYVKHLNPKRIIALGEIADKTLELNGLKDYVRIPHPAYWSRFHHDKTAEYVELVGHACKLSEETAPKSSS